MSESSYRGIDCENCGRFRVESDGICEKCKWDNDAHNYASITRAAEIKSTSNPEEK